MLLHTSFCPHVICNSWNMLSFHSLVSEKLIYVARSLHYIFSPYFYSSRHFPSKNILFDVSNDEHMPYRKPEQTEKVKQPSRNTTTEPFQSWSTNVTKDIRRFPVHRTLGNDSLLENTRLTMSFRGSVLFYGEFGNPFSRITSLCMASEFDLHWLDSINGSNLNLFLRKC